MRTKPFRADCRRTCGQRRARRRRFNANCLKTAEQPRVVIAKDDIEVRKISPKSMMPDGQLDQMKEQEVIDLIKYLRTTEQVEMAK